MSVHIYESILRWMSGRNVGASSKAMAYCAAGIACENNHPYDPDDFNRCLLLVAQIPEVRESFPKIAALSPEWKAIIENWDALECEFIAEVGLNWSNGRSAPKTYAMMRRLLDAARETA